MYRHEAVSIAAFIQQLAVSYVSSGYFFYVTGHIREGKDAVAVDRKLVLRYGVDISKWARARRKRQGFSNVHYLRHGRFFVLIASHGRHRFFGDEETLADIRRVPLRFAGYSVSYRRGHDGSFHPSVRIEKKTYLRLKSFLCDRAASRSFDWFCRAFSKIPFEPYAPVRRQLLNILRAVNRRRKIASLEQIPVQTLRLRRRPLRVFAGSVSVAAAPRGGLESAPSRNECGCT